MTVERPSEDFKFKRGVIEAETVDGKKIRVELKGGRLVYAADRKGKQPVKGKGKIPPPGTIESLYPLLREAFGLYGVEQDEEYWVERGKLAKYTPEVALKILRRAGFGIEYSSILLVNSVEKVQEFIAHGEIDELRWVGIISQVMSSIAEKYPGTKKIY